MKNIPVIILFFCMTSSLFSQKISKEEYICKYYEIAVNEMQNYGIPASITMAQGILESACGNGSLAKEANNHFGIKCHEWTGPTVYKDDDRKNECFRKYFEAEDSYKDHSLFLATRDRYAFLFELDIYDYKAWAKGLKKAGYATDPHYPDKLIRLIEASELYLLDAYALSEHPEKEKLPKAIKHHPELYETPLQSNDKEDNKEKKEKKKYKKPSHRRPKPNVHSIPENVLVSDYGIPYVVVQEDITYSELAMKYHLKEWEIYKFNDLDNSLEKPGIGERIYLDYKAHKAIKGKFTHTVVEGETMHEISQQYGIRLKSLYKINGMDKGTQAPSGSIIKLNKKATAD